MVYFFFCEFGKFCLSSNWSISSRLSSLWAYSCSLYSFIILLMPVGAVMISPLSFLFCFFKINFYWSIVALQCYVSTVQQNESAIHIHIPLFFGFPSHLGHHSTLSRVPCAIQYVLISCLFYTQYQ